MESAVCISARNDYFKSEKHATKHHEYAHHDVRSLARRQLFCQSHSTSQDLPHQLFTRMCIAQNRIHKQTLHRHTIAACMGIKRNELRGQCMGAVYNQGLYKHQTPPRNYPRPFEVRAAHAATALIVHAFEFSEYTMTSCINKRYT